MKTNFSLLFIFLYSLSFGIGKESIIPYEIKDLGQEDGLPIEECRISFKFYDDYSKVCNTGVIALMDKDTLELYCDKFCEAIIDSGQHQFNFYKKGTSDVQLSSHFEGGHAYEITVYFQGIHIMVEKPVIYVHSNKQREMKLRVNSPSKINFSYPTMQNNGWLFEVDTKGNISIGEDSFNYLFWDGQMNLDEIDLDKSTNIYVPQAELLNYLEEVCDQFGFTGSEKADFITYWYPQMKQYHTLRVKFLFNSEAHQVSKIENSANLPVYQLYMFWEPYEAKHSYKLHKIAVPKIPKSDDYILEWGGAKIS